LVQKVRKTHATNEGCSKVSMIQDKVVKYILFAIRVPSPCKQKQSSISEVNLKTETSYI